MMLGSALTISSGFMNDSFPFFLLLHKMHACVRELEPLRKKDRALRQRIQIGVEYTGSRSLK